jgi:hypothetical protein
LETKNFGKLIGLSEVKFSSWLGNPETRDENFIWENERSEVFRLIAVLRPCRRQSATRQAKRRVFSQYRARSKHEVLSYDLFAKVMPICHAKKLRKTYAINRSFCPRKIPLAI